MKDERDILFDSAKNRQAVSLSRREFIKLAGGGIVVFFSIGDLELFPQRGQGRDYPADFNAYLRIGEDGRIACFSPKIEMGQGVYTSLAQMLAEELDVPLDAVDMVMGDTDLCPWDAGTFGSRSTKYFGPPLRQAAAEARAVLLMMASERLKISEKLLVVENGIISVTNDPARKITYAELAKGKRIERFLDQKPPIKHYSKHTLSGQPKDRLDGLEKVTGEAKFAGDIRKSGILFARILRPPVHGAKLKSVDLSEAKKTEGVRIIEKNGLIAVLHEHYDVADQAIRSVKAEYDIPAAGMDNESVFRKLREATSSASVVSEAGNLSEGERLSSKKAEHSYFNHYVAHAPSEPHTALAWVEGNKATVWASTQAPFRAREDAAQALDFPEENVRVITPFVGCGFGGKNSGQQVAEAALLSKLSGRAVQVAWSRKEEFFYDTFRPAAVIEIKSGLDSSNRIVFWDYHNYFAGSRSSEPVYHIPHHRVLSYGSRGGPHPFGTGAWRGPGSNSNVFAIESQIDVLAEAAGMDPMEFRVKNLKDERMLKVLDAAGRRFGKPLSKAPSGKGYGLACTDYLGTYVATLAEVEVDEQSGQIRVKRIVCAQDTGEMINPEGIRMQIEGCLTMGLGYCLTEEVRFKGGQVLDENFDTYEIPRFSWLPEIETVLVDNPELAPQGCGEPAITTMGAVIANAVYDIIGVRQFTLPMTRSRIRASLSRS